MTSRNTREEEPRKEGPWTSNKVGGDAGGYISNPQTALF
jgi:hypothetical protein